MSSKFAALAANVATPFRVELVDPVTGQKIVDADGTPAFIDILSTDSREGRAFDAEQRRQMTERVLKGDNDDPDPLEVNMAKTAQLTAGWHLVEPASGAVLDVPCTPENALELYCEPGMGWLFSQVWAGVSRIANFMPRSTKH